jgi:predicted RNase H-like HicB family nuclease
MPRTIEITVELTPDLEVGGYVAYCPELDITTEGETIEEAMAMMKEAAEGYLELVESGTMNLGLLLRSRLSKRFISCRR